HMQLTMDWDDGFIAWLDGVYITNRTYASSTEPLFTATTAGVTHESSRGASPSPARIETYDLGAVGTRTGTHVLAIVGLNSAKSGSSDFILIADLSLTGGSGGAYVSGAYGTLVNSNSVTLTGSNTVAGSSRVAVNGDDAAFVPAN